jgi:flavorubredoxin
MESRVTEVAPDVFRISTFDDRYGIQMNQYLVRDDEPFLMHTMGRGLFAATSKAVASLIDPSTLRWIGFSHFEADECGALNDYLKIAPRAQAVCSFIGATITLADCADRPARALADGEVLETGRRRLQFIFTPHVPHGWDAGFFFETTDRTLFCSDLCFQPGDPGQLTEGDIVGPAGEALRESLSGPLAHDMPYTAYTDAAFARLAALKARTLGVMHGPAYRGDCERVLRDMAVVVRETLGR